MLNFLSSTALRLTVVSMSLNAGWTSVPSQMALSIVSYLQVH